MSPAPINDRREPHEMGARIFVVMHDKVLSNWGLAPNRSFFVVACPTVSLAEQVAYHAENRRTDMKRVSIRHGTLKSALASRRLCADDHVSVIGVNCQWLGWPISNHNKHSIREQWKEEEE